jgi:hypothetical protein
LPELGLAVRGHVLLWCIAGAVLGIEIIELIVLLQPRRH